jgi:hypothetical protein
MDPEDLRKALIQENAKPDPPAGEADPFEGVDDLVHLMRNEAKRINAEFVSTADSSERRRLSTRYAKLDAWLTQLTRLEAENTPEAAAERDALRALALENMRNWRQGGSAQRSRVRDIDQGHKHLKERAKPGAGAATGKRIRDEIEYLLKNYTPSNEAKIETLIDKWRRSGDPGYDPGIKTRLRNARKKKNSQDYAL